MIDREWPRRSVARASLTPQPHFQGSIPLVASQPLKGKCQVRGSIGCDQKRPAVTVIDLQELRLLALFAPCVLA